MSEECLSCLGEIKKEGIIYGLVIKNIDEILSKERITSQDVVKLTGKLKKYDSDLPMTRLALLASTQLLEYKKKLEDANQPIDLIKEELKRIKGYIEPAIEASRETLNKARKSA